MVDRHEEADILKPKDGVLAAAVEKDADVQLNLYLN